LGSTRRAASANGSEHPIAPATPFTSRRRTGSMLWPHRANSPPSPTSTVSRSRPTNGRSARNTSAGCSPPPRCQASGAPPAGPLAQRGARLAPPSVVARSTRGADDERLGRAPDIGDAAEQQAAAFLLRGALDEGGLAIDGDQPHGGIEGWSRRPLDGEVERLAE